MARAFPVALEWAAVVARATRRERINRWVRLGRDWRQPPMDIRGGRVIYSEPSRAQADATYAAAERLLAERQQEDIAMRRALAREIAADLREEFPPSDIPAYIERTWAPERPANDQRLFEVANLDGTNRRILRGLPERELCEPGSLPRGLDVPRAVYVDGARIN